MSRVQDKDYGYRRIERELVKSRDSVVLVGIQSGTLTKSQVKGFRTKEPGLNMAEIGFYNEFGTSLIPSRSFMRSTFDEQQGKISAIIRDQFGKILDGKTTVKRGLGIAGLYLESEIKKKIRSIYYPPNAPSTIAKKGSSKPLIDFGQMIQSIVSKVIIK